MRSPQRRTQCQENETLGRSNATRQCAALSQRTHCPENQMLEQSNATRQCAALSGEHIAKKTKCLGNGMQQDNAQTTAAYAL